MNHKSHSFRYKILYYIRNYSYMTIFNNLATSVNDWILRCSQHTFFASCIRWCANKTNTHHKHNIIAPARRTNKSQQPLAAAALLLELQCSSSWAHKIKANNAAKTTYAAADAPIAFKCNASEIDQSRVFDRWSLQECEFIYRAKQARLNKYFSLKCKNNITTRIQKSTYMC